MQLLTYGMGNSLIRIGKNKNFETPGYGKELVSQVYDPDKWERALTACKDALEWAEGEGGCGLMTTKRKCNPYG